MGVGEGGEAGGGEFLFGEFGVMEDGGVEAFSCCHL